MKLFSSQYEFEYSWDEVSTANWRKYCPWNKESSHVIAVDTLSRRIEPDTGILRTERLITCKQSAPRWLAPFLGSADVSYVYEISRVTPPSPSSPFSHAPHDDAQLAAETSSNPSTAPSSSSAPTAKTTPRNLTSPRTPFPAASGATPPPQHATPVVEMSAQNLTWCDLLSVRETVRYVPSPADPLHKTRFEQHAEIRALCGGWQKVRERIEGFTVERFGQNAERGRAGFEEVLEMSRRVFGEQKERERKSGKDGMRL